MEKRNKNYRRGQNNKYLVVPVKRKDNIETYFHKAGYKYALLDLKHSSKEPNFPFKEFWMEPSFNKNLKANWSNIYDGVFYIDEMSPQ